MTAKRTHGPCTCIEAYTRIKSHRADCPAIYPAQQEPDALTRLVRHVRNRMGANSVLWEEDFLSLIADARAEMGALRTRAEKAEQAVRLVEQMLQRAITGEP